MDFVYFCYCAGNQNGACCFGNFPVSFLVTVCNWPKRLPAVYLGFADLTYCCADFLFPERWCRWRHSIFITMRPTVAPNAKVGIILLRKVLLPILQWIKKFMVLQRPTVSRLKKMLTAGHCFSFLQVVGTSISDRKIWNDGFFLSLGSYWFGIYGVISAHLRAFTRNAVFCEFAAQECIICQNFC